MPQPRKILLKVNLNSRLHGSALLALTAISACKGASTGSAKSQALEPKANVQVSSTSETEPQKSCHKFVQSFYDSYFDKLNTEITNKHAVPAEEQVLKQQLPVLAPELTRLLAEDRKAQDEEPGDIVGLDFDPFINAQDWGGKYWVESVNVDHGICHANVWGIDAGIKKPVVKPDLKMLNNNWVFTDFFYPEGKQHGDASLKGTLIDLRMIREQSKNKKPQS